MHSPYPKSFKRPHITSLTPSTKIPTPKIQFNTPALKCHKRGKNNKNNC